jgi:hypothetical protein
MAQNIAQGFYGEGVCWAEVQATPVKRALISKQWIELDRVRNYRGAKDLQMLLKKAEWRRQIL